SGPAGAQLVDLLRRVVVDAATRLHAEAALIDEVADGLRDLAGGGQVLVQVRADGVVDVEPGHVEQLHGTDDGQLVADPPPHVEVETLRIDDAAVDEVEALAQDRVEDAVLDKARHLLLHDRVVSEAADQLVGRLHGLRVGLLAGNHLDHRDQVGRIRPVHADDTPGVFADRGDLRDRYARGVGCENRLVRDVLFELREDLLLELELLGYGLEHEIGTLERRRELGLEADAPTVDLRRLQSLEHALAELHPGLGALPGLLPHDADRRLDPGARQHCAHARAHRARANHSCSLHFGHLPSFFSSWILRQTLSGVSGSSDTGTPASATAVAMAAVAAASEPSPHPLSPY